MSAPTQEKELCFLLGKSNLAAAFTEWERRFREEPEAFMSDFNRFTKETPESMGEQCASYLMLLLGEA